MPLGDFGLTLCSRSKYSGVIFYILYAPGAIFKCTQLQGHIYYMLLKHYAFNYAPGTPGGPLKYKVVSRHDQGFLKYTLNKYFLLEPKYTLNADFMHFLTNFIP